MDIYPCLGLKGGRWVALHPEPGQENKPYPDGPVVMAGKLEKQGARWLHLVDVDGAKMGRPRQMGLMRSVLDRTNLKVQVGGGFRTELIIRDALRSGISRVVVGTRAVTDAPWLDSVLAQFGNEQILVSLDAVQGIVAVDGWETRTTLPVDQVARRLASQGVERLVYTDILADSQEGQGPNLQMLERLAEVADLKLIVSGGIRRLEQLAELEKRLGSHLDGVIIARGLADTTFDLTQALEKFSQPGVS